MTAGLHAGKLPAGSSPRDRATAITYQATRRCAAVISCQFFGGHVMFWTGSEMLRDALAQSLHPWQREGR